MINTPFKSKLSYDLRDKFIHIKLHLHNSYLLNILSCLLILLLISCYRLYFSTNSQIFKACSDDEMLLPLNLRFKGTDQDW